MKRYILYFLLVLCTTLLTGCGHNMYFENETTGLCLRIPIAEGADLGLMVGSTKSVTATVRGGTSFTTESSNGAGILSGDAGIAKITQFKSNTQINEGNIVKVLTDTNVAENVKLELVKHLDFKASAPDFKPSILQTRSSVVASSGADVSKVKPFNSTGVDKIIEIAPAITAPVIDAAKEITTATIDAAANVTNTAIENTADVATSVGDHVVATTTNIVKIFRLILTIFIVSGILSVWMLLKPKKKKATKKTETDTNLEESIPLIDDENGKVKLDDEHLTFELNDGNKEVITVESDTKGKKKRRLISWLASIVVAIWLYLPSSWRGKIVKRAILFLLNVRKKLKQKKKEEKK